MTHVTGIEDFCEPTTTTPLRTAAYSVTSQRAVPAAAGHALAEPIFGGFSVKAARLRMCTIHEARLPRFRKSPSPASCRHRPIPSASSSRTPPSQPRA
jgi:hypothetical protein